MLAFANTYIDINNMIWLFSNNEHVNQEKNAPQNSTHNILWKKSRLGSDACVARAAYKQQLSADNRSQIQRTVLQSRTTCG